MKQEREDKQATTTTVLVRYQLNQDRGNLTSPYHNFPTNISGHTGSVHIKEHRAKIKVPSTRIQKTTPTSAAEAHMGAPDKGGRKDQ